MYAKHLCLPCEQIFIDKPHHERINPNANKIFYSGFMRLHTNFFNSKTNVCIYCSLFAQCMLGLRVSPDVVIVESLDRTRPIDATTWFYLTWKLSHCVTQTKGVDALSHCVTVPRSLERAQPSSLPTHSPRRLQPISGRGTWPQADSLASNIGCRR